MENEKELQLNLNTDNTPEKKDENGRFLPIGSVVLLKGGKRELMIVSYCVMPSGEVYDKTGKVENFQKGQIFDYGACFYPDGMVQSDQIFAFNHEQIARVCFKGYESDNQKELSYVLNGGLEAMKNQKAEENK